MRVSRRVGMVVLALAAEAHVYEGYAVSMATLGTVSTESGKLYSFKATDPSLGTFSIVQVVDTAPSGPELSDVHEAKIDFSGFAGRAGFIFRF